MYKIAVLMSTYNGGQYLTEQIDSILMQEDVDIDLFIRDDGSNDDTVEIIKNYCDAYGNVRFVDDHKHYGPEQSFMELLYAVDSYDYYAFADQDDIWKPQKLRVAIQRISHYSNEMPCLYFSNQILFVNGLERKLRYSKKPRYDLAYSLHHNLPSGCTMVFNSALKRYFTKENKLEENVIGLRMHDVWVHLFAFISGMEIYDHESYIDYRIHDNNTVGVPTEKGVLFQATCLWRSFLRYLQPKNNPSHFVVQTAAVLLEHLKDIRSEDRVLLLKYVHYRDSIKDRIALLLDGRTWRESSLGAWIRFEVKVLLGWM